MIPQNTPPCLITVKAESFFSTSSQSLSLCHGFSFSFLCLPEQYSCSSLYTSYSLIYCFVSLSLSIHCPPHPLTLLSLSPRALDSLGGEKSNEVSLPVGEVLETLNDLIAYFQQPDPELEHEEKQRQLRSLIKRQDLFKEEVRSIYNYGSTAQGRREKKENMNAYIHRGDFFIAQFLSVLRFIYIQKYMVHLHSV